MSKYVSSVFELISVFLYLVVLCLLVLVAER